MTDKLKDINRRSPFLWEVVTDGTEYTILCECETAHDDDDTPLENLDRETCIAWLDRIYKEA